MPLSKKVCLIIGEALWFQPLLQVGKQVVVARSNIRVVRRVVKELPVEMPRNDQECSAVYRRALLRSSTTMYVSILHLLLWMVLCSFLVFWNMLVTSVCSLVAWIPLTALFWPKKTAANSFLADICLNFPGLFGDCVCSHCFDCSLASAFINET
jgi:hypothetical protein